MFFLDQSAALLTLLLLCVLRPVLCGSEYSEARLRPRDGVPLRILAMGDSITFGWWSTDLNGYRLDLLQLLQYAGYTVEYAGLRRNGTMVANQHEAFPGETINEIHRDGFEVFAQTIPNVVLLHAGTNDAIHAAGATDVDVVAVANQMIVDLRDLIDDIFDRAPNACVIVAQIVRDLNPSVRAIIDQYNGYIPYLVDEYSSTDHQVIGVSMADVDLSGPDHDSVWANDPTHPGNGGFKKMASNFFLAIKSAAEDNLISNPQGPYDAADHASLGPTATNPSNDWASVCDYNATWPSSPASMFPGPKSIGGQYFPTWLEPADFTKGAAGQAVKGNFVWLADYDADGFIDYLYVDASLGSIVAWKNIDGTGSWKKLGSVAPGLTSTPGAGVIMADMTGDGYADYVWQSTNGDLTVTFNYYSHGWVSHGTIASGFGGTRSTTHLADIDGDGRSDLIWIDSSGNINAWLNTGVNTDISWKKIGVVGAGLGRGDRSDRFVDVNGDGRCDYVRINTDGSMDVWLNPDLTGFGAPPSFIAAGRFGSAGSQNLSNIHLADMNGDRRADIILVDPETGALSVTANIGLDGFGQLRFADGNADGRADAFFISNGGAVQAWRNDDDGFFRLGNVFQGTVGPKYMRLADINAVSHVDVIIIDPSSCKLTAYLGDGTFGFGGATTIWSGGKPGGCQDCSGIQFTDNNGDGRADLVCVTSDAAAWLTYNYPIGGINSVTNINWTFSGWILINQGAGRNQARFADLNGDGIDDVMVVNGEGGIHAFVSGTSSAWQGGNWDEFPDIGAPYSQVLLADMNAGLDLIQGPSPPTSGPDPGSDDGDDDEDDQFEYDDVYQSCDYTVAFTNMDDLVAASGGLRADCLAVSTLNTLIEMFDIAYDNYTTVNEGYDDLFGYYVTYMKDLVPNILDYNFMFNLSTTPEFHYLPDVEIGMDYFDCTSSGDGGYQFPCADLNSWVSAELLHASGHGDPVGSSPVTMTLKDESGYNASLVESGITPEWVVPGDFQYTVDHTEPHAGRSYEWDFTGFPTESSSMTVPNPKDIITKGLGNIPELRIQMMATLLDMMLSNWEGGPFSDPAQVYSVPVFLLMQAVESMQQAKDLAAEEKKKEEDEERDRKKNFILLIISLIFVFVPFVGEELAAAAGFATLARAIALIGEVGNTALGVYDTVQDPSSAVLNVLGSVIGFGAIARAPRDGKGLSSVATTRREAYSARGFSGGLGRIFEENDGKMQDILNFCKVT